MFERAARQRLHRLGLAQREERLERLGAERRASALRHALEERLGERLRERRRDANCVATMSAPAYCSADAAGARPASR